MKYLKGITGNATLVYLLMLGLGMIRAEGNWETVKGYWRGELVEFIKDEIVIGLSQEGMKEVAKNKITALNLSIVHDFNTYGLALIKVPQGRNILSLIPQLNNEPSIAFAEPNVIFTTFDNPNDTYYSGATWNGDDAYQWAHHLIESLDPRLADPDAHIRSENAWTIEKGSANILIAVLDTGIPLDATTLQLSHPDLNQSGRFIIEPDADMVNDGQSVRDNSGHGTHVLGIIAAETNNNEGIAGTAWYCKILVIQVFKSDGTTTNYSVQNGINYAANYTDYGGVDIINLSGGSIAELDGLRTAVENADSKDIVQIYPAGNYSALSNPEYKVVYPAKYGFYCEGDPEGGDPDECGVDIPSVISVAATDPFADRSNYSCYKGDFDDIFVSVAAPGGYGDSPPGFVDIFSTTPNYPFTLEENGVTQQYGWLAGTSMSAPFVAGLASLILSYAPNMLPAMVRQVIEQTADDINSGQYPGEDKYLGHGRINAYNALNLIKSNPSAPTNLTLSGGIGDNPTLNWNANPEADIDVYKVYRNVGSGYVNIATVSSSTPFYTDTQFLIGFGGTKAYYRIKAKDIVGNLSNYSNTKSTKGEILQKSLTQSIPDKFTLLSNHPNPFNPTTLIQYGLPVPSHVELKIFDFLGREVKALVSGAVNAGFKNVQWDGKDQHGKAVASGMYIYQISARSLNGDKKFIQSRKMVLLR